MCDRCACSDICFIALNLKKLGLRLSLKLEAQLRLGYQLRLFVTSGYQTVRLQFKSRFQWTFISILVRMIMKYPAI